MTTLIKMMLLLLTSMFIYGTTAEVEIENNGYSGILVAIHEDIPENPLLLQSIKNMITEASPRLYKRTKQRAYFKQVTIAVPSTWSSSPNYKLVPKDNYMGIAEVHVAPAHPNYGITPYTIQLGGCGERGRYIHMTPEFLLDKHKKTNALRNNRTSQIFLHEWCHLRYGIFDEFGEQGNAQFPIFYKIDNDKFGVNGCSDGVKGFIRRSDGKSPCTIDVNNQLNMNCTFYPDFRLKNVTNGKASLMYMPEMDSADGFCNDTSSEIRHNPFAPNMHNRICDTRSVTDVILSNDDFKDNRNAPRQINNLTTDIHVVQLSPRSAPKFVLVLDVSHSMNSEGRFKSMQDATMSLIKYHIKDDCNVSLGMVSFSKSSATLASLTLVNNSTRNQLIQKIPKSMSSYTCIGCGLLQAIEVLKQSGAATEKSKLVLFSDGEENKNPLISETLSQLKQAGVVVYSIAIGKDASAKLEDLSRMNGGKADLFNPIARGKSMDSILSTMVLESGCDDASAIINFNRANPVPKGMNISGTFEVDNNFKSTIVFISYDPSKANNGGHRPIVTITDPRGKAFNDQSSECITDENLSLMQFEFPEARIGTWDYRIENPGSRDVRVNIMVHSLTTNANSARGPPIYIETQILAESLHGRKKRPVITKIIAELTKDGRPIVGAKVTATGQLPNGTFETIVLKDNGIGADRYKNDGVYSEYFTRYNGNGRYQFDVYAKSTNRTKKQSYKSASTSRQRAPVMPILPEEIQNEEPRAVFFLSELQKVNEIFESSAIYTTYTKDEPDFDSMDPVEKFERYNSAGTFLLDNWSPIDMIPPGKITDLIVLATDFNAGTVQLEWSSPGDNMFDGQAKSIELRYNHDPASLVRSFETSFSNFTVVNGSLDPLPAYEIHTIVIQLPREDMLSILNSSRNIYFALRAQDEEGNVGQVSYAAIADFPLREKLQPTNDALSLHVIIAIAVSSVIVILIVIVVLVKVYSRKKKGN